MVAKSCNPRILENEVEEKDPQLGGGQYKQHSEFRLDEATQQGLILKQTNKQEGLGDGSVG